jgi:hypothetical protein
MANGKTNGKKGPNGNMKTVRERFANRAAVQAAVNDSMRNVRILHKKMGVPLVGVVDGKRVEIPAEEIQIDDPPTAESK